MSLDLVEVPVRTGQRGTRSLAKVGMAGGGAGEDRLGDAGACISHNPASNLKLGSGMPSYWSVEQQGHKFDLGLSGWTENDWSAAA